MRLGLRTTLGISLALHTAVLLAILRWGPRPHAPAAPRQPLPVPIAFVMPTKRPPVVAPAPAPAPAPAILPTPPAKPPPPRRSRAEAKPVPGPPKAARQEGAERPPSPAKLPGAAKETDGASGRGPRAAAPIDLFAGIHGAASTHAGAESAAPGDPNATQRAVERLQALKHSLRGQRMAQMVPRGVKAFGERLNRTFVPDPEALKHASRLGIGTGSTLPHYFNQKERQLPVVRAVAAQQARGGLADRSLPLGLGIGEGVDHDASTLRVEVVVLHDAAGRPQRWSIPKPSGESSFDESALISVRDAAQTLPVWHDGVPRETHWEFELQALRWGRAELLLDPGFVAPGREIENGIFGKTTVVQAVRLTSLTLSPADQGSGSTKQLD